MVPHPQIQQQENDRQKGIQIRATIVDLTDFKEARERRYDLFRSDG